MSAEEDPQSVRLDNVRLSFPDLWTPTESVKGGKLQFRANFLIDPNSKHGKANMTKIAAAQKIAEADVFKKRKPNYSGRNRLCVFDGETFTNGETGDVYDGYEGLKVVKALSPKRPAVVDCNPEVNLADSDGRPYSGCFVNAFVRFYCVTGADSGGDGFFCSLKAVQFYRDGAEFGAAPVIATNVFANVEDEDDDVV